MIAQLTGILAYKSPQYLIIDIGGVGYRVMVSLTSFSNLPETGEKVTIHTHTHIREDQLALFGFTTIHEKEMFQKFINISGVGPKMALTILSGIPTNELINAIVTGNVTCLQSIPGIGKKTAERIIIELKDKIQDKIKHFESFPINKANRFHEDILSALTNLGYQKTTAERVLKNLSWDENTTIETAIRETLKEMTKR